MTELGVNIVEKGFYILVAIITAIYLAKRYLD